MKSYVGLKLYVCFAAAILASAAFGAASVGALHAQAKSAAYAIIDIGDIYDPDAFRTLVPMTPAAMSTFGGQVIVRTDNFTALDGIPPNRLIVIRFESVEKAKAWDASAGQQEVDAIRIKSTKSRAFIVEGM
jgi:uncharacterized protein (DUF1330 family)